MNNDVKTNDGIRGTLNEYEEEEMSSSEEELESSSINLGQDLGTGNYGFIKISSNTGRNKNR